MAARLVVRTSLNLIRRRRRRPIEIEIKSLDVPSVEDESGRVADREVIDEGLRRLPPEWRAIVVLHFYVGLSLPETALALGIPVGTVSHGCAARSPRCGRRLNSRVL